MGDVLTSMVKVLSQMAYSLCFFSFPKLWVEHFGSHDTTIADNYLKHCVTSAPATVISTALAILPLTWRLLQCMRRFRHSGRAWPHLANAGKYGASILVVLVAVLWKPTTQSKAAFHVVYVILYVISTLYSFT